MSNIGAAMNAVRAAIAISLERAGKGYSGDPVEQLKPEELEGLKQYADRVSKMPDYIPRLTGMLAAEKATWKAGSLVIPIVVTVVLALIGFLIAHLLGAGIGGLIGLVCLIVACMKGARQRKVRRLWLAHGDTQESVITALEQMEKTLAGSPIGAMSLMEKLVPVVGVVLCVAAIGGHYAINGEYLSLCDKLTEASTTWNAPIPSADEYLEILCGEDGELSDSAIRALTEVMDERGRLSNEHYCSLALAAHKAVQKGFNARLADEYVAEALNDRMDGDMAGDTVLGLMTAANVLDDKAALLRAGRKGVFANETVIAWIRAMPLPERLSIYSTLKSEWNMDIYMDKQMKAYLADAIRTDNMCEEILTLSTKRDKQLALSICGSRETSLDSILELIRLGAELGLKPSECFEEDPVIDIDMTRCNYAEASDTTAVGKYLVVRRQEDREKYEELRSVADDYESHTYSDKESFTITLALDALDVMPSEWIPETMAECVNWLVLDSTYERYGAIESTTTTTNSSGWEVSRTVRDIPTYYWAFRVTLFDVESGAYMLVMHESFEVPPEIPYSAASAENYYHAKMDQNLMTQKEQQLIDLIVMCDGNPWLMDLMFRSSDMDQTEAE